MDSSIPTADPVPNFRQILLDKEKHIKSELRVLPIQDLDASYFLNTNSLQLLGNYCYHQGML
jgi:hypothetical protein